MSFLVHERGQYDEERAELDAAIVRAFSIPPAQIGEPAPEQWRPCIWCGITWQLLQFHRIGCPVPRMDPTAVRTMHVLPAPMPFLRARIGRTTLPWEAQ